MTDQPERPRFSFASFLGRRREAGPSPNDAHPSASQVADQWAKVLDKLNKRLNGA